MSILPRQNKTYPPKRFLVILTNNLIPIIGVIFFGWNLPNVFVIYWIEAILYCLFIVVKILFPKFGKPPKFRFLNAIASLLTFSFLLYIYGMGVISLFIKNYNTTSPYSLLIPFLRKDFWGIVMLVTINVFTFVYFYFVRFDKNNPYVKTKLFKDILPVQLIVLHLTIIFGGIIFMVTALPVAALVIFMGIKTILELL